MSRSAASAAAAATAATTAAERAKQVSDLANVADTGAVDNLDVNKVFSIKYHVYLTPADRDSVEETTRVDADNAKRYAFNMTQEPMLKMLMTRLGIPSWKIARPELFKERAMEKWQQKIREPSYKTLAAIEMLGKRGKLVIRDYAIDKACELADEAAVSDFIQAERKKTNSRYDIRHLVPNDHHLKCSCNYIWDGKSTTCAGGASAKRVQVTWRTKEDFHFLQPEFEIFVPPEGYIEDCAAAAAAR